ncbi:MAG: hypothetical protein E7191_00030 [Erysipelotrichaceae bacterium]|nr:hypothetical protein [Erysipelotrichaceae bacterium]
MANWITHTRIADVLLEMGLEVDKRGFCIGNIAPDCNIENEDWSAYIPSREVTHFMKGEMKDTSDPETFYVQYIQDQKFLSQEHYSYLLGYYSHLITDIMYHEAFSRDPKRIQTCFKRIKTDPEMAKKIEGYPETFDTLKEVFGRWNIYADIIELENQYIQDHPQCSYNTLLPTTTSFPDYIDFFPTGAITRKIPIMLKEYEEWRDIKGSGYFFSIQEYEDFIEQTAHKIYTAIRNI